MNINFEVTRVDENTNTVYIKYWADGATLDRFEGNIGPYSLLIRPEVADMTPEEFLNYIAMQGHAIVFRQLETLAADSNGAKVKFKNLVGQTHSVSVPDEL